MFPCHDVSGNQKYSAENDSVQLFAAKIGHSYSCKDESVFMGNGLSLEVSNNRMQAFNVTKNEFGRRKCHTKGHLFKTQAMRFM